MGGKERRRQEALRADAEEADFQGGFGRAATDQVPVYNPGQRPSIYPICERRASQMNSFTFWKVSSKS